MKHAYSFENDFFASSRLIWQNRAPGPSPVPRGYRRAKQALQGNFGPPKQAHRAPKMQRMSNKQLFKKVIGKLPHTPAALKDIKKLMVQAVDLMDDNAINKAANEFAKKKYGALGAMGASMVTPAQKRATVKRMINAALTKHDIKNLIAGVSDASFDAAVNQAMSNSKAVQKLMLRPENTFIAKRMAGAVLNRMHPQRKKGAMLQIINESSKHEIDVMKWMINKRIRKASSKNLQKMAEGSHDAVLKEEFGEVGAWFVDIVYHMGLVSDNTIKSKAMQYVNKLDKRKMYLLVSKMDAGNISGMMSTSLNSWGYGDTAEMANNPRAQASSQAMALRSAKTIMRWS